MYKSPFRKKATLTCAFKKAGNWRAGFHTGEDWVCDDDTILSPCDGYVSYIGYDADGYGNYIILHTDDGKSILMAHFKNKPLVKTDARVKTGDIVATMGSTGNSTGKHLHIEVENYKEWNYGKNLVKPSDYIEFNNTSNAVNTYKNGSTKEYVYSTVSECKSQSKSKSIGYLEPYEVCERVRTVEGVYLVLYNTSKGKKCGFVKFKGV